MTNGGKPSEWVWDKLSRAEKNIDWVKGFFWFGLITIGIILVTFITSLILKLAGGVEILYIPQDQLTKHHYLLSATSQVLAAIFALVFSITLIVTQFVTKYTHRTIGIVFPKRVFFYILGFALAVIFPLWWLVVPFKIGSFISVVVASLFVFSIPGFFIFLTRKMRTDGVIKHLKTEAIKAVNLNDEENAKAMVNALDNIGMGAYTDRNFEVFEMAETALVDLALGIEKKYGKLQNGSREQELHASVFDRLRNTYAEVVDNPRAPWIVLKQLVRIGVDAKKRGFDSTCMTIANNVTKIERITVERAADPIRKRTKSLSSRCGEILHKMIMSAPKQNNVTGVETNLIHTELNIYKRHLDNGWPEYLLQHMEHTAELLCKIGRTGRNFSDIVSHFFRYAHFFTKTNDARAADYFAQILSSLNPTLESCENISTQSLDSLVFGVSEYVKQYPFTGSVVDDENWTEVWQDLKERMYMQVALIATIAIRREKFNLCYLAQHVYTEPLPSGKLTTKSVTHLLNSLIEQTNVLIKYRRLNEEWAARIVEALTQGLYTLEQRKREKEKSEIWKTVKPLAKKLFNLSLLKRNQWHHVLKALHKVFTGITVALEKFQPPFSRDELFQNLWLTLAALESIGRLDSIDLRLFSARLSSKRLLHLFLDYYEKAKSKMGRKTLIPHLDKAFWSLLNQG